MVHEAWSRVCRLSAKNCCDLASSQHGRERDRRGEALGYRRRSTPRWAADTPKIKADFARADSRRVVLTPDYRAESYGPFKFPIENQLCQQ